MIRVVAQLTDAIEARWRSSFVRKTRAAALVVVLTGGVLLIELARRGMLPSEWSQVPSVHLAAIAWAVTLLLVFEMVEMVLSLGRSVADSVGRHLLVYALLLLRDAFSELSRLPEPIAITSAEHHSLLVMGADATGAIVLFVAATFFSRLQHHTPIVSDPSVSRKFVAIKKSCALLLIATLAWLCARDVASLLWGAGTHEMFDQFFTVLVFVDVLFAIVSLGFTDHPQVVFRNFGFAFAAILLRLAVASPEFVRPVLGIVGAGVAILVTLAYNLSMRDGSATSGPVVAPFNEGKAEASSAT